jgi:TRAP-type C4-dicarboxylate transport system permease small subunit
MTDTTPEPTEIVDETPRAIPEAGLLGKLIDRISDAFAIAILASAGILIIEVFLRYVFNAPTIWGHETVVFLTAVSFLFGGLFVAARNAHIRVVLVYDALSPPVRRVFDIVISLVCALSCLFFSIATWPTVMRALYTPQGDWRVETSGTAFNAPYPGILRAFLLAVLVVMTLQFIVLAYGYARGRR